MPGHVRPRIDREACHLAAHATGVRPWRADPSRRGQHALTGGADGAYSSANNGPGSAWTRLEWEAARAGRL
jgi:hypothetical protein